MIRILHAGDVHGAHWSMRDGRTWSGSTSGPRYSARIPVEDVRPQLPRLRPHRRRLAAVERLSAQRRTAGIARGLAGGEGLDARRARACARGSRNRTRDVWGEDVCVRVDHVGYSEHKKKKNNRKK